MRFVLIENGVFWDGSFGFHSITIFLCTFHSFWCVFYSEFVICIHISGWTLLVSKSHGTPTTSSQIYTSWKMDIITIASQVQGWRPTSFSLSRHYLTTKFLVSHRHFFFSFDLFLSDSQSTFKIPQVNINGVIYLEYYDITSLHAENTKRRSCSLLKGVLIKWIFSAKFEMISTKCICTENNAQSLYYVFRMAPLCGQPLTKIVRGNRRNLADSLIQRKNLMLPNNFFRSGILRIVHSHWLLEQAVFRTSERVPVSWDNG